MRNIRLSRYILILLIALCTGSITAFAQFTETREFRKEFKVTDKQRIEISNKYGKIELFTWNKDSVVFEVKMKVEEKKLSKLDKALDNIDFDFTESEHYLIGRTIADKNRSQLGSEFLKFKETLLQTDGNVEVDFNVWIPASSTLIVENKFGDIYMDDFDGKLTVKLSNGKLKAHDLNQQTSISLNFADATINKLTEGRIEANYSDVYIKYADQLTYDGKSSEIELIEAKDLTIKSRRDKFRLRRVGTVEAEGNFSNFRISDLTDRAKFQLNYGHLEIENVLNQFENIYIESKATDIGLYFNEDAEFQFEINNTKADIDLSRDITLEDRDELDSQDENTRIKGYLGTNDQADEKLYINAVSGQVTIETN